MSDFKIRIEAIRKLCDKYNDIKDAKLIRSMMDMFEMVDERLVELEKKYEQIKTP
jgi:hypothetical protein